MSKVSFSVSINQEDIRGCEDESLGPIPSIILVE